MAHLLAIPMLATPATAITINNAGATAAAPWIIDHLVLLNFTL